MDLTEAISRIAPGTSGKIEWYSNGMLTFKCTLLWLERHRPCYTDGEAASPHRGRTGSYQEHDGHQAYPLSLGPPTYPLQGHA